MGVPRFFRTVSERYPHINVDLASAVAPAVDNLYIDMNGVVHNCARGSSAPGEPDSSRYLTTSGAPRTYADTFLAVFKYLDNLFSLVAPRKVVYMAIDGVAPRAKMNQQRSRRFRSAKEREDEHARKIREDPMYKAANITPFDSNCITPGTAFMAELTEALDYFVHKRVTEDAAWAGVEVILSGAEVPGEGEHKIMEYIRAMKHSKSFAPDTRHCVYGLDADLIMLGLVTHEPHFLLLREKVDFTAFFKRKSTMRSKSSLDTVAFGEFQLLSVGLLREYIALDVGSEGVSDLPFFDVERIVDDFVFIAMLVGNDFLPHLPTVEMADGALGTLLQLYRRLLPRFGGYITDKGVVVADRFELFALMMGLLEAEILPKINSAGGGGRGGGGGPRAKGRNKAATAKSESDLDATWGFEQSEGVPAQWTDAELQVELTRVRDELELNQKSAAAKRKYYLAKVGFDCATEEGKKEMRALATSYVEGVCWTLRYYFEGCADWRWFYPYHYAPMSSDLVDVAQMLATVSLTRGTPFKPMEQLLSVLPPSSAWCLPKAFQRLMTHPSSPIRDKYPLDFEVDMNGKRNDWEAVVLLPFIDEDALLSAVNSIPAADLSAAERIRNSHGTGKVFRRRDLIGATEPVKETVKSPFPGRLPCLSSIAETYPLELPFVSYGVPFQPSWTDGTHAPSSDPKVTDLPTFLSVPHSARRAAVGVNVFGQQTRHESLMIRLGEKSAPEDAGDAFGFVAGFDSEDENQSLEPRGVENGVENASVGLASKVQCPVHWSSVQAAVDAGLGIGKSVWVGFPWRLAGIVHGLSDAKRTIERTELEGGGFAVSERPTKKSTFNAEALSAAASLMDHRATDVDMPAVLFRICVATEKDILTGTPIAFTSVPAVFPSCSVVSMKEDDMGGLASAISKRRASGHLMPPEIRAGETVVSVGRGNLLGCTARVEGTTGVGTKQGIQYIAAFSTRVECAREPAFTQRAIVKARNQDQWHHTGRAASILNIPPNALGAITGSVRVKVPNTSRDEIDVGLGIKYSGRNLHIPGYAKLDDRGQFVLSGKTINLVMTYRAAFPDMFSNLLREYAQESSRSSGGARVFEASELFGKKPNAKEMLTAAASWVATSEVALLPLVSGDVSVLPKAAVVELEKEAAIALALQSDAIENMTGKKEIARVRVNRSLLVNGRETDEQYARMVAQGAAPCISSAATEASLGDRVVNRRGTGPVPFGLRGTIVAIHPAKTSEQVSSEASKRKDDSDGGALIDTSLLARDAVVEVVFDEGFIGGGDLNGRCSVTRGKAVSPSSLLPIKADRGNVYYTRNYNRIASTLAARNAVQTQAEARASNEKMAKSAAMAKAAVLSYAAAARSAVQPTPGTGATAADVSSSRTAGVEFRPQAAALPLPSFAVRPSNSKATGGAPKGSSGAGVGGKRVGPSKGGGVGNGSRPVKAVGARQGEASSNGRGPSKPVPVVGLGSGRGVGRGGREMPSLIPAKNHPKLGTPATAAAVAAGASSPTGAEATAEQSVPGAAALSSAHEVEQKLRAILKVSAGGSGGGPSSISTAQAATDVTQFDGDNSASSAGDTKKNKSRARARRRRAKVAAGEVGTTEAVVEDASGQDEMAALWSQLKQ